MPKYIFDLIRPIISECNSPEESRQKIIEWGKLQEPRDAVLGLMAVDYINSFLPVAIKHTHS